MAVEFITGRPGGGKTLLAVRMIEEEMRTTKRYVVTNIQLKLEEVAERFGAVETEQRVRVLSANEAMAFWLFLPGRQLPQDRVRWTAPDGREMEVPDFSMRNSGGVLYVIDEAHIPFSNRTFYKNGTADAFFYLSQHEKLGDSVLMVTQHCENVDKQFRSVAQSFTEVRNGYRDRWPILGGLIRARPGFNSFEWPNPPGSGQQQCTLRQRWRLEPEKTCKLYDTTAGLGLISKAGARHEKPLKGLPWWSVIVGFALVAVAVVMIPELIGKAVGAGLSSMQKGMTGDTPGGPPIVQAIVPSVAKSQVADLAGIQPGQPKSVDSLGIPRKEKNAKSQVRITGWSVVPKPDGSKEFAVFLSNGRRITKGFRFTAPDEIEFQGVRYSVGIEGGEGG